MPNSQELIPIIRRSDQEQWIDARTLHKFLEVGKDFSTWVKDYIKDFGFVEGRDFSPNLGKSTGGRQAIDYAISLDMAKHLSMLQRSEKGMQARQYFIQAEKELRKLQTALLSGYDEMEQLLQGCRSQMHNGELWYAATQLRNLAGKGKSGGNTLLLQKLRTEGLATKLYEGLALKWYVKKNAINRLLNVRPHKLLSVAIVKLLSNQQNN